MSSPATTARDHVFVHGLRVLAIIGIHPHERVSPQPIVFDIDAATATDAAAHGDHIAAAGVNYERLREIARRAAIDGEYQLVESLAEHIAREVCTTLGAPWVRVRVGKPDGFGDADLIGVVIERTPASFR